MADVELFCEEKGLMEFIEDFRKGALVAQNSSRFEAMEELTDEDKHVLRRETTHRWRVPFMMYFLAVLCAGSAVVQGMDQTAVNGAQM